MDFETTSNQSDDLKSSMSHCCSATSTHNDSGCDLQYEDRDLSCIQLLENNPSDSESKYRDKIETLLRHNNRIECDLRNANEQVERLLGINFINRGEQKFGLADEKSLIFDLERKCHELTLHNSCLQTQLLQVAREKDEYQSLNKSMKIEVNECKSQLANKTVCVAQLKDKISEQFISLQSSYRSENILRQLLERANSEVEHLKNTQEWYKQQLSQAQTDKRKLTEDLLQCKLNLSTGKETLEMLQIEVSAWKNKFDALRVYTQADKASLSQEETKTLSLLTNNTNSNGNIPQVITENSSEPLMNLYRCEIQDLQKKIFHINEIINEQDKSLKKMTNENSLLTSRCIMLQKTLQQKEYFLEKLEVDKMQLLTKVDAMTDENKKKYNQVLLLKDKVDKLEMELSTNNSEKGLIKCSIETIREQFFALKLQYTIQKHEIGEKNKQMLQLQTEKQELFMNNNWKVCEAKEKNTQIEELRNKLVAKNSKINNHSQVIKELLAKIIKNEEDKEILIGTHSKEMERYESVLLQYRKTVEEYKNRIHYLQDIVEAKSYSKLENTKTLPKTEMEMKDTGVTEFKCNGNVNEEKVKIVTAKKKLHDEVDADKGEKHFLQRLCNDLRLTLKSYINYNNVLKEQLNRLLQEKDKFNSLPVISSTQKYNEQYVNKLLLQQKMSSQDEPLPDVQSSLDNLKREIFTLQQQIFKKDLQNIW